VHVGLPLVLRAQNVESDLWRAAALHLTGPPVFPVWLAARVEAWRLGRWEGHAVGRVDRVVALTGPDAQRLEALGGYLRSGGPIDVIPAPFPASLPAGVRRLAGDPAVVVLGSAGWFPNRDAARFMAEQVWPEVVRRVPGAVLHLFGAGADLPSEASVRQHPAPADSAVAFAPGSVMAVPLRVASGVRMKILEAWARGVPVVATPEATAGLEAEDGRELLVANRPQAFAAAIARLAAEPALAERLIAEGRRALARRHSPEQIGRALKAVYASLAAPSAAPRG
jgi:glycosyltransferase involved in cell wall biosynthesis